MFTSRRTKHSERGSETLESAILYPVVFLVIFGLVQLGAYFHAENISQGAATAALNAARVYDGNSERGRAAGQAVLQGAGIVDGGNVTVSRTATTTTVTVTGRGPYIIPGLPNSTFSKTVSAPTERYVQ